MIFDCFTYFNESVTLDFRLNYLAPFVDYFVIVESGITFSGQPKSFTAGELISRQPQSIIDKCRLIQLNHWPPNKYSSKCNWEREFYQRNAILQGLHDISHGDFVFITDVDEIPNPDSSILSFLLPENTLALIFVWTCFTIRPIIGCLKMIDL